MGVDHDHNHVSSVHMVTIWSTYAAEYKIHAGIHGGYFINTFTTNVALKKKTVFLLSTDVRNLFNLPPSFCPSKWSKWMGNRPIHLTISFTLPEHYENRGITQSNEM